MDNNIPKHVAIIMDGNRRWAKNRGLSPTEGHRAGADNLKELGKYVFEKGVKYLSVFAFSTENFNREEKEVNFLMDLVVKFLNNELHTFKENGIKIVVSGRKTRLNNAVLNAIEKAEAETKDFEKGILNICLNYGGQFDIVDASKKIAESVQKGSLSIDDINEEMFGTYLYKDLPPIDLMIRTSNEIRISNFMLWHLAYAEMYFTETFFPDFNKDEFEKALLEYNSRDRRFGGNSE